MGNINKQIEELRSLAEMDMLPSETKEEIRAAIKLAESVQEYDNNDTLESPTPKKLPIKYINKSSHKNPTEILIISRAQNRIIEVGFKYCKAPIDRQ